MVPESEIYKVYPLEVEKINEDPNERELSATNQWLAFRVRTRLVDSIVTAESGDINLLECFDVVYEELGALRSQVRDSLAWLDLRIVEAGLKKDITDSKGCDDYTEVDLGNLRERYEDCASQAVLLRNMQENHEELWVRVERLVALVRDDAYNEAVRILQEKVHSTEQIAADERSALERKIQALEEEILARDIQAWDEQLEATSSFPAVG